VWTGFRQPLYFDTAITTRGFTGHEEIDPMGLIHMNGRVYDPELSCFSSKQQSAFYRNELPKNSN
jgi:hypothetical protein